MDAAIAGYLDHLAFDRERAPGTVARYRALLGRFAAFAARELGVPGEMISKIDRKLVERFVREGGVEGAAPAAPSTRNVRLAAVSGLFAHLAAERLIDRDPTVGLRAAKVRSVSPGFVTESEFGALVAAVHAHASEHYAARDAALMAVMFHAGLRISEALSLDTTQVDLAGLRFRGIVRKGRMREDVVMNTAVADAIRRWFLYRPGYPGAPEAGPVFVSDRGKRLSPRTVQRAFKRYVGMAGFGGRRLTPHSLRHSCATALALRAVGIEIIAEHLGHRKLDTTRIYVRVAAREKQAAVELLSAGSADGAALGEKARNSGLTAPITQSTLACGTSRKRNSANRKTGSRIRRRGSSR